MAAKISKEYAAALYALAMEAGCEDEVRASLDEAKAIALAQPEYLELLNSPGIPIAERLALLDTAFADISDMALDFLKLLCERGHMRDLASCAAEYAAMMDARLRVSVARVTSARALTEDEKIRLKEKLEQKSGRTIELECAVDPALIGGMILEMDDRVMDGSLRSRLNEIKEVIGG